MRFKTCLLTVLLTTGFFFPSCDYGNDCGGGTPPPQFFDIEGMSLRNYKTENEFAFYSFSPLDSGALIGVDSFRLNIQFDVSYFGDTQRRPNPFSLGIMNSTLACDPAPPSFNGSQEQLESLTVITLTDWDSLHVAGDTINDLLYIYEFGQRKDLNDFLLHNISFIKEEEIGLQLKSASDTGGSFSAKVVLKLKNGEEYSAESEVVNIR